MLISCPNCKTTFAVAAKQIGSTGRKLKCSKCAHIWMQGPISFDKEKLDNLLQVDFKHPPTNNLPVSYKKPKVKIAHVITFFWLITIIFTLQILKKPVEYPNLATKMNVLNFEGLRFHNFKVESERVDNKLDFYLKGSIVNITDKKIKLPVIGIKAYSQGGRVMAESRIHLEQEYAEPFSKIDIAPEITRISGNADKLELSFENWIEALIR